MPRGLNGTHRELSLTGIVVPDIRRPPALQAREDPNSDGGRGPVRFAASFAAHAYLGKQQTNKAQSTIFAQACDNLGRRHRFFRVGDDIAA